MTAPTAAPRGRKAHDRATDEARLRRYGAERRPEDREWLVERYLPLARHVAARYSGGSEPIEDLQQVAVARARQGDRPLRPVARDELLQLRRADDLRRAAAPLPRPHVGAAGPRDLQELAVKIGKAEAALQLELGRAPTAAELADQLDCSVEELLEARDAAGANRMSSLDRRSPPTRRRAPRSPTCSARPTSGLAHVERALTVDAALERAGRARARDPAAALPGGAHAGGDRRAGRALADARLAADPPGARHPARRAAEPGDGLRDAA